MRLFRHPVVLTALFLGISIPATSQESDESSPAPTAPDPTIDLVTGPPLVLSVARQYLKNFLTDETALAPFKMEDGTVRDLESVFTIGTVEGPYAVFWDPISCRLLGALDLKAPAKKAATEESTADDAETDTSPYAMLAAGAVPFAGSIGAYGEPEYFGFRMVNGKPAFLYTQGSLVVEERLWLDNGGDELKQMFTIRDPKSNVSISLPEDWKARAESSVGEWKENVLSVPKEEAAEFIITYQLDATKIEPAESK